MNSVGDSDGGETTKLDRLKPHTCTRCGKRFASGSALGGHRTVHGPIAAARPSSSAAAEAPIACSVCGAAFKSWKSVYGHMHVHRHRGWRGMHPPAAALTPSPSPSPSPPYSTISDENPKTRRLADLGGAAVEGSHVCRICGVSCPTHQSLGGHVAAHNRRKNVGICSKRSREKKKASGDKEDGVIRGCRVKKIQSANVSAVKFDLNELPPMEDNDDE